MEPAARPPLDASRLADLRAFSDPGEEDLAREVAEIFLEIAGPSVAELGEAVGRGHAPDIQYQAHRFRGSAGNIGALVLSEMLLEIENGAKDAQLPTPADFNRVRDEVRRVESAIRTEFAIDG